uniref:Putative GIY-YIG homing endonuclease n=1 Tax=Hafniomonas laevis TaxID=436124 RepID=A0A0S2LNY6_9CHLO|nr:putative GIY-YIG homing endonuclease [Hafniomonas laevis]ALO63086.1 putative GIY-YIG homing endonuclease [Hafniomonas laevis]
MNSSFVVLRKKKSETRLNGKSPFSDLLATRQTRIFTTLCKKSSDISGQDNVKRSEDQTDNSVSNQIQPRKQPGVYMIRCIANDKRYYGESCNISSRLASHKSQLHRNIHPSSLLQRDFNCYGLEGFNFVVLYMGSSWEDQETRRYKELELIIRDRHLCYNKLDELGRSKDNNPFFGKKHSEETKQRIGDSMRGVPNDALGKAIMLNGVKYPSIAEASRQTKMARKTIRKRLQDPNDSSCIEINLD